MVPTSVAKPSKQYIQLNLSNAPSTVSGTDAVSRDSLQKSLQIECIKPTSTWEWCCLQPARMMGSYLSVKIEPDSTIYVVRSHALKLGLKKEDLRSEKSFQQTCVNINTLVAHLTKESWQESAGGTPSGGSSLKDRAISLIKLSTNLKKEEAVAFTDPSSKAPFILRKNLAKGGVLEIIAVEEKSIGGGGYAAVHRANDCAIRVSKAQATPEQQQASAAEQAHAQEIIGILLGL